MEIEKNEESAGSFSEEQLLVILLDLFLAGSETTSSMLSFTILLLLKHQDIQDKVRAEIDSVIGDREVQLADKKKYNAYLGNHSNNMLTSPFVIIQVELFRSCIDGGSKT